MQENLSQVERVIASQGDTTFCGGCGWQHKVRVFIATCLGWTLLALAASGATIDPSYYFSSPNGQYFFPLVQPDGKVVLRGSFIAYGPRGHNGITRLDQNGAFDTTFNPLDIGPNTSSGVVGPYSDVRAVHYAHGGFLVLGGGFTNYNGVSCKGLVALQADGNILRTYPGNSTMERLTVTDIGSLPSGAILVTCNNGPGLVSFAADGSGGFTYETNATTGVVRPFGGFTGAAAALGDGTNSAFFSAPLHIQAFDDKIVCNCIPPGGVGVRLVRLNANGTVDGTFSAPIVSDAVGAWKIAPHVDGKLLVTSVINSQTRRLLRLMPNGQIDSSFVAPSDYCADFCVLPDNKVMAIFYGANGARIERLLDSGLADSGFRSPSMEDRMPSSSPTSSGPNTLRSYASSISRLPSGDLLVSTGGELFRLGPDFGPILTTQPASTIIGSAFQNQAYFYVEASGTGPFSADYGTPVL